MASTGKLSVVIDRVPDEAQLPGSTVLATADELSRVLVIERQPKISSQWKFG
jgi:hypothetical protein